VTDHVEYYAYIESVVRSSALLPSEYERPTSADSEGLLVGSNFERKYHRLGKHFYAIAAVKR
jgi:hypothetical protein